MKKVGYKGPKGARLLIVGEAPGAEEEVRGEPFIGASGMELTRMLDEVGLVRHQARIANVCQVRPPNNDINEFFLTKRQAQEQGVPCVMGRYPVKWIVEGIEELRREIREGRPEVILALGDTALWALTGKEGIGFWRGSRIDTVIEGVRVVVYPTWHPAMILRQWSQRVVALADMQRVAVHLRRPEEAPSEKFSVAPESVEDVTGLLQYLVDSGMPVAVDLETDPVTKHITCVGLAWSESHAMCIPFVRSGGRLYWKLEEEVVIVRWLRRLLEGRNNRIIGHNYLFDMQMLVRWWGFRPALHDDTMVAQHVCYAGMLKALDFCASVYLPAYVQWSLTDEDWKEGVEPERLWVYNCRDAVKTWALWKVLDKKVEEFGLREQYAWQMRMVPALLDMMLRGIKVDMESLPEVQERLKQAKERWREWLRTVLGHDLNVRSAQQMKRLFYEDLRVPRVKSRKTGKDSFDKEAMAEIAERNPLLRPLLNAISSLRTLEVLEANVLKADFDVDGRARTSFNLCGTHTFRLSSSESVWGTGLNLQNIPKPDKGSSDNIIIRKLFVADTGYVLVECDLERADLQVVVWEADDVELKQALRSGEDLHWLNARAIFGAGATKKQRELAKKGVHLSNYGGTAGTLAVSLGITRKEAEHFQKRWFASHPGIKRWHRRVEFELLQNRTSRNAFGYRRVWFDRVETLLPKALAWVPQSTVGLVINRGILAMREQVPEAQILAQIHDSVVFQVPAAGWEESVERALKALRVVVPYSDPLIIPASAKYSFGAWSDCVEYAHGKTLQ